MQRLWLAMALFFGCLVGCLAGCRVLQREAETPLLSLTDQDYAKGTNLIAVGGQQVVILRCPARLPPGSLAAGRNIACETRRVVDAAAFAEEVERDLGMTSGLGQQRVRAIIDLTLRVLEDPHQPPTQPLTPQESNVVLAVLSRVADRDDSARHTIARSPNADATLLDETIDVPSGWGIVSPRYRLAAPQTAATLTVNLRNVDSDEPCRARLIGAQLAKPSGERLNVSFDGQRVLQVEPRDVVGSVRFFLVQLADYRSRCRVTLKIEDEDGDRTVTGFDVRGDLQSCEAEVGLGQCRVESDALSRFVERCKRRANLYWCHCGLPICSRSLAIQEEVAERVGYLSDGRRLACEARQNCSADLQPTEFSRRCQASGSAAFTCDCRTWLCSEASALDVPRSEVDNPSNDAVSSGGSFTGFDLQGRRRSCPPPPDDLLCPLTYTPARAFASSCRSFGHTAFQCSCEDWLCSDLVEGWNQ